MFVKEDGPTPKNAVLVLAAVLEVDVDEGAEFEKAVPKVEPRSDEAALADDVLEGTVVEDWGAGGGLSPSARVLLIDGVVPDRPELDEAAPVLTVELLPTMPKLDVIVDGMLPTAVLNPSD